MLIAQMSDIHIGFDQAAGSAELNEVRYRAALAHLLAAPVMPDLLVLSGDLTDRGDAASFARLVEPLGDCPFPVYPLVGNHDTRASLIEAFPDCPVSEDGFIHYTLEREGLCIMLLDSVEEGRHGGAFCAARAHWLADQLAQRPDIPTVIFIHHPPVLSGIDWMDPPATDDWIGNLQRVVAGHRQIRAIHCGHLHRPLLTSFAGIALGVTGSIAPAVALDLRPVESARPDGRLLIAAEPPVYALHHWDGCNLATHYQAVGDWAELARFDPSLQPMMREMFADRG